MASAVEGKIWSIVALVAALVILVGSATGAFFAEATPIGDPGMLSVTLTLILLGAVGLATPRAE